MRTTTTFVSLRVGTEHPRGMLQLKRVPKYLRFVMVGTDWKTLDALDQLDDTPRPDERVIVGILDERSRGSMHIDGRRNGKRFAEWHQTATYDLVPEQPPQDVLRDTAKWREWCFAQPGAPIPPVCK